MRLRRKLRASAPALASCNAFIPGRVPEFCVPPSLQPARAHLVPAAGAALPRRWAAERDLWLPQSQSPPSACTPEELLSRGHQGPSPRGHPQVATPLLPASPPAPLDHIRVTPILSAASSKARGRLRLRLPGCIGSWSCGLSGQPPWNGNPVLRAPGGRAGPCTPGRRNEAPQWAGESCGRGRCC